MKDYELVERMLDDVKHLSYESFMIKYEPGNTKILADKKMKLQHLKLKASLKLFKVLGKQSYDTMVNMILADKKMQSYMKRLKDEQVKL